MTEIEPTLANGYADGRPPAREAHPLDRVIQEAISGLRHETRLYPDVYAWKVTDAVRAALVPDGVHFECDCVPHLGSSHCHACGDAAGQVTPWSETPHRNAVEVDVAQLDAVIEEAESRTVEHARQNPEGSVDLARRMASMIRRFRPLEPGGTS